MKSAVVFLGFLSLVWTHTTDVSTCLYQGGAATFPINTSILGCTTPPCAFPQLTHVEIQLIFRAPRHIHSMRTLAYTYVFGGIGAPYNLRENAITCNFLSNTYCPLQRDEVVIYNLRMFIEEWMPAGTSVTIEFVIRDTADNTPVACIRTQITILPALLSESKAFTSNNNTLVVEALH